MTDINAYERPAQEEVLEIYSTVISAIPNRCDIFDYETSPGRRYRIRHGTSTATAVHVSMSVTRDRSHGCIRYVRDYGYVIASSCGI
jgi:hypothetical protein